jgi:uncharacterized protein
MSLLSSGEIVKKLALSVHPEGGYYREVYRSEHCLRGATLGGFDGDRDLSTAIYFMLEHGQKSVFHRIKSDEIWHHYLGQGLEIIELHEDGQLKTTVLGKDILAAEVLQYVVPAGVWFGARVVSQGSYALLGCTVAPGFDFADFEMAKRGDLLRLHPSQKNIIMALT